jgi:hypothetical protein
MGPQEGNISWVVEWIGPGSSFSVNEGAQGRIILDTIQNIFSIVLKSI